MKCIDLFCGAGGLTKGLEIAGWKTVAAFDSDLAICKTYNANFSDVELICSKTQSISFSKWKGKVELVVGGPPCQPFSVAGRQLSSLDPRDCIPEFIRAVSECQPEAFLMENVAGLASPRHSLYLQEIIRRLKSLGYKVHPPTVLDAATYGVPQHRRRLFIVGTKSRVFEFPPSTHGPGRAFPYVTAGHALVNPPDDYPNTAKITYAKKPVLRPQPWDGMMVNGGGRPINLKEPSQTIPASAGGNRTHILDPDGVLIEYHKYLLRGGKPRQGEVPGVRRLTVSESARLQAFPDDFVFLGMQSTRYRQVGNAIPPLLAYAIGKSLIQQLSGEITNSEKLINDPRQLTIFA